MITRLRFVVLLCRQIADDRQPSDDLGGGATFFDNLVEVAAV